MRSVAGASKPVGPARRQKRSRFLGVMMSTTAVVAVAVPALAQPVEEIVVTGTRIVRDGYEAPTPLTVVGAEALEQTAATSLATFLSSMPALSGSSLTTGGSRAIAPGTAGMETLNLRSLNTTFGGSRVLVLLDGQRTVPSSFSGLIDIGNFPSQLISRVDIVTGGASAVYGSDAVAGVVNVVLDKDFTGIKGELSAGVTNYGDNKNYTAQFASGFPFAQGRGHVLLSGKHSYSEGIRGDDGGRGYNRTGAMLLATNPAYTATNGQPFQLFVTEASLAAATAGGIIVSGPLKGTAFGAGGTPYQFQYGPIVSGVFMQGGDWKANDLRPYTDLDVEHKAQSFFTRVSYDLADTVTAFVQWGWSQNKTNNDLNYVPVTGGPTSPTIRVDNAFLPATVRAAMVAANLTSFQIGTWNIDMPKFGNRNRRMTNRLNAGLEGSLDAFGSAWTWNAYFAYGATKTSLRNPNAFSNSRYRLAADAVVNPANGQIVCRSVLQGAANGCQPWNLMGIGVNTDNSPAFAWMNPEGGSYQNGLIEQETYAASVSGEPFSNWAGPVSLALSFEHRKDTIHAKVDAASLAFDHVFGIYAPLDGAQSVTEGAVETVVPLAMGEEWAESWDFTAAARFTGYEYAGYVTTWKVGTTFTPVEDIKFRITRSRDIRAPNIQELFAAPAATISGASLIDRFLNNAATSSSTLTVTSGNPNLVPEKADTTGVGVVLSPRFLPGFTVSADYWDVNIGGAIQPLNAQQVIDTCFSGQLPALCPNIIRDAGGLISQVKVNSINLAVQNVRGLDLEASYRVPLSDVVSGWAGEVSLHGFMTFYFRNYQDNTFNAPTNRVGENSGNNPPDWKLSATATYQLDPVTVALTARAFPSGTINATAIECTSGCPTSTTDRPTINYNRMSGEFYVDANVTYALTLGDSTTADLFLSARNLFNNEPPPANGTYYLAVQNATILYDTLGTVYRAGIRFRM